MKKNVAKEIEEGMLRSLSGAYKKEQIFNLALQKIAEAKEDLIQAKLEDKITKFIKQLERSIK